MNEINVILEDAILKMSELALEYYHKLDLHPIEYRNAIDVHNKLVELFDKINEENIDE